MEARVIGPLAREIELASITAAASSRKNGVFLINQKGTPYYKIGFVTGDTSAEEILDLAQEGSPKPLAIVEWTQSDDPELIATLADERIKRLGRTTEGGWIQLTPMDISNANALIAAGNPCHLPAGSQGGSGGQFGPKGSCPDGGGWPAPAIAPSSSSNPPPAAPGANVRSALGKLWTALTDPRTEAERAAGVSRATARDIKRQTGLGKVARQTSGKQIKSESHGVAWAEHLKAATAEIKRKEALNRCIPKPGRSAPPGCGVYIIQSGTSNRYKIGKTVNLEERLDTLQTGSPDKLTVVGFIPAGRDEISSIESSLHKRFKGKRVGTSGSAKEWFTLDQNDLNSI